MAFTKARRNLPLVRLAKHTDDFFSLAFGFRSPTSFDHQKSCYGTFFLLH